MQRASEQLSEMRNFGLDWRDRIGLASHCTAKDIDIRAQHGRHDSIYTAGFGSFISLLYYILWYHCSAGVGTGVPYYLLFFQLQAELIAPVSQS